MQCYRFSNSPAFGKQFLCNVFSDNRFLQPVRIIGNVKKFTVIHFYSDGFHPIRFDGINTLLTGNTIISRNSRPKIIRVKYIFNLRNSFFERFSVFFIEDYKLLARVGIPSGFDIQHVQVKALEFFGNAVRQRLAERRNNYNRHNTDNNS